MAAQQHYHGWLFKHDQLTFQRYASHPMLANALRVISTKSYSHVNSRSEMRELLTQLVMSAPFSRTVRFPAHENYVRLTGTAFGDCFDRLIHALDLETRTSERGKTDPETSTRSYADACRSFATGLQQLEKMTTSADVPTLHTNGLLNRDYFETMYELEWQ